MKNLITTFLLLLLVSTSCFPETYLSKHPSVDEYFDSYKSNVSWSEQRARLDNFAIALLDEPDSIGYIGFESNKNEPLKKAKQRISRAANYLIYQRKIDASRIVVIYIGQAEEPHIILQPVVKGGKPPFKSTAG